MDSICGFGYFGGGGGGGLLSFLKNVETRPEMLKIIMREGKKLPIVITFYNAW